MKNKSWSLRNFIRFIKSNDLQSARDLLEERIKVDPNDLKTLEIASDCYLKLNLLVESLEFSKNILKIYPDKSSGFVKTAKAYIAMNQLDKAQDFIDKGLQKIKYSKLELLKLGSDISREFGLRSKSLEYLERINKRYPKEGDNFFRLLQDKLCIQSFKEDEMPASKKEIYKTKNKKVYEFYSTLNNKSQTLNLNIKRKHWINSFSINRQTDLILNQDNLKNWQPFQYWSQGQPPEDVRMVTDKWNLIFKSIGIPSIKLFDKNKAEDYISKFCPQLSIAFSSSWHYAMESDVFRIAFAQKNNCIWLDSDLYPLPNTKEILIGLMKKPKTTLYFRWWKPRITNAFFMTPSSSVFFNTLVNQGQSVDFNKLPKKAFVILKYFGPGAFENTWASLTTNQINKVIERDHKISADLSYIHKSLEKQLYFVNEHSFALMDPPYVLGYKKTTDHWQKLYQ